MRLLFVLNALRFGGAERHTLDLIEGLKKRGDEPALFAMGAGDLPAPVGLEFDAPASPRSLVTRIRELAGSLTSHTPDLIVAVNDRPALAATAARSLAEHREIPCVMIWHSTIPRGLYEHTKLRLQTPLFNRLEGFTFISSNQRDYWKHRGIAARRERLILNGVDVDHYCPEARTRFRDQTRADLEFPDSAFVIGLSAVMRPEKNHFQLVDALPRLRLNGIDARALFVGDGPMRAAIEERALSRGVKDSVVITGIQSDVRPFLAAFDVGALCSTKIETLSLSALEIMAMGIPTILSDIGGASEIADGHNGRVVPVGNLDAFCEALTYFAAPEVRAAAGVLARQAVCSKFNRVEMIKNYAGWFDELTRASRVG